MYLKKSINAPNKDIAVLTYIKNKENAKKEHKASALENDQKNSDYVHESDDDFENE